MLTESFIASVLRPDSVPSHVQHKDAGIYFHELQPLPGIKSILKKSSTKANCLAATSTHVFAAQADKAVVHVYNIERGTQECLVPFSQRISSLALIGQGASNGILVLGDEAGKVILWELATGRQIQSPSAHLQPVTCLAVDPTDNFLLSGSADTNVHVWSIPSLLSFASSNDSYSDRDSSAPLHTLSNHRGVVTSLAIGHSSYSANFAVSASEDKSCIVWDYQTGNLLHTFLLTAIPLSLGLDPADRGFYAGLEDGSVQMVDFYHKVSLEHPTRGNRRTAAVTEPPKMDRWTSPDGSTAVRSLAVTYDGTKVLTGLDNGKVYVRDVGTGRIIGDQVATLLGAVTNIAMRPVQGLARSRKEISTVPAVVKPKHVALLKGSEDGANIPENYTFHACFKDSSHLSEPFTKGFISAVFDNGYSRDMIDHDLASLQVDDGSRGSRSIFTAGAGAGADEAEIAELHKAVARSTQESLELRERMEELGKDLVRMKQAEQDRQRHKELKQKKRAQAYEPRRKKYMEKSSRLTDADLGPPLGSDSSSDDLSMGG